MEDGTMSSEKLRDTLKGIFHELDGKEKDTQFMPAVMSIEYRQKNDEVRVKIEQTVRHIYSLRF